MGYFINRPKIQFNKTQYDWFPGKGQNSKKFSAKFKQNPTTSKNHRVVSILKIRKIYSGVWKI